MGKHAHLGHTALDLVLLRVFVGRQRLELGREEQQLLVALQWKGGRRGSGAERWGGGAEVARRGPQIARRSAAGRGRGGAALQQLTAIGSGTAWNDCTIFSRDPGTASAVAEQRAPLGACAREGQWCVSLQPGDPRGGGGPGGAARGDHLGRGPGGDPLLRRQQPALGAMHMRGGGVQGVHCSRELEARMWPISV